MNSHKLLLLLVTVLLPQVLPLSARHHETLHASRQEYGDTTSLLSSTTQELRQAYDLLGILKRRSQEIATKNNPTLAAQTRLPKDLDALRDRMIKQPLITVLSATPFSDPDKHTSDCKTAISALESYSQTIQSSLATHPQAAGSSALATPADLTNLTKTYDLGTSKTETDHTPKSAATTSPTAITPPVTPTPSITPPAASLPIPQPVVPEIKTAALPTPEALPAPIELPAPLKLPAPPSAPAALPLPAVSTSTPTEMPQPIEPPLAQTAPILEPAPVAPELSQAAAMPAALTPPAMPAATATSVAMPPIPDLLKTPEKTPSL
jgi:hypothetical protein